MSAPDISDADKLAEIERELRMRRQVFGGWVARGKITESQAMRRIAIMEAIRADYAARVAPILPGVADV
jgi:hypothetical protein